MTEAQSIKRFRVAIEMSNNAGASEARHPPAPEYCRAFLKTRSAMPMKAETAGAKGSRPRVRTPMVLVMLGDVSGIVFQLTWAFDSVDQPCRNDADPVPRTHVSEQGHHRVRFENWCATPAAFLQHSIDDATALRIRRQETKRKPCSLAPGHFVETCKRIARADEHHVPLFVERHRVQAPDRLVVDVGNANIDLQISNFDRMSADMVEKTESRTRG